MRYLIILIVMVFCFSCERRAKHPADIAASHPDTVKVQPKPEKETGNFWIDRYGITRNPDKDSIAGKPVKDYLNDPQVAQIAKDFYTGKYRPTDNDSTTHLLELVKTKNKELRPFYRWCLDETINIADGALGEYPGEPAMQYVLAHPAEFFIYMDKDTSGKRYNNWVGSISYSGLSDYTDHYKTKDFDKVKKKITADLLANCSPCTVALRNKIEKLSDDVVDGLKNQ
jgi:hypothetical protein